MPNLSAHPLIKQSYDVSQAIEACGASPALTAAVMQSSALTEAIDRLVHEQCLTGPTCIPLDGLQPHEQRVVVEKAQLDARLEKLRAFLQSGTASVNLDADERILLDNQLQIMYGLTAVLGKRIQRFKPAAAPAVTASTHGLVSGDDFPLGKACDLSGEGGCEACQ